MTDLERYKELFKSTLLEFKEIKFKVKVVDRIEEREGVVEDTGELVKLNIAIYKHLEYTGLELYSGDCGPYSGSFDFDENGKFTNFTATGDY